MDSFKSWLVANIEVVLIVFTILFLIFETLLAIHGFKKYGDDAYYGRLFICGSGSIIICIVLVGLIRSGFGTFLVLLIVIGFVAGNVVLALKSETEATISQNTAEAIEMVEKIENSEPAGQRETIETVEEEKDDSWKNYINDSFKWQWLLWLLIPAFIFGIFTAIYANRNFDDVVSRRFFYRNSDVSVFEYRWLYTFNRLYAGTMSLFAIGLEILAFIALKVN